jgi:hypothetical protein
VILFLLRFLPAEYIEMPICSRQNPSQVRLTKKRMGYAFW